MKVTKEAEEEMFEKADKCDQKDEWNDIMFKYLERTKLFKSYP